MKRKQLKMSVIAIVFVCVSMAVPGFAQVPQKINYQGFLTDSVTGLPVTGDVEMTFSIYDVETGGTALWTETRTVTVTDGQYSIQLGDNTPIDLLDPKPYWLGVQVGTDSEMTPREELTSVLYALFAKYLEGITIKDGKVGIGTDDPQEMLDVHGNAHIRGTLHVGANSILIGDNPPSFGPHVITTDTPENNMITFDLDDMNATGNVNAAGNITSAGNITATGSISAGAISTTEITVNGKIKGNKVCIGNDCRSNWPEPCSHCLPDCENGQTVIYNGRTAKWECDGEPVPVVTTKPLYRLYLGVGGNGWTNHLDSLSANEIGTCQGRLGYVLESQVSGTKPLYRKYRSHNGNGNDIKDDHMTTDNANELTSEGWNNEGIFGYIYTTQVSGTIPLYLKYREYWYNTYELGWYLHRDYITTTDRNEGDSTGWEYVRVLGYIEGPASSSCN